jgi:hypothetical protein
MLAPVGALVLALVFLVLGIANAPAGVLDSLVAPGLVVLGAPIALGMLMIRGSQAMRTHRYRIDPGGAPAAAILHEVAHADKGAQFGGRTVRGRVYPNGSGYVDVRLPAGAPIEHHVAVDMAGARGEGEYFWTSPHARGDRANAAARVAHLPPKSATGCTGRPTGFPRRGGGCPARRRRCAALWSSGGPTDEDRAPARRWRKPGNRSGSARRRPGPGKRSAPYRATWGQAHR